jgi:hypothetical protein
VTRLTAALVLALPFLGLLAGGDPAHDGGPDAPWDGAARGRELEAKMQEAQLLFAASHRVLGRLAAGELSLADAAAEVDALFRDWPEYRAALRLFYPGSCDRECFARSLTQRVRTMRDQEPGRYDGAAERIGAELAALYPPGSPAAKDRVR